MQDNQLNPTDDAFDPLHFTSPTSRNLVQDLQQPFICPAEMAMVLSIQ
jgi:hypothetical protein